MWYRLKQKSESIFSGWRYQIKGFVSFPDALLHWTELGAESSSSPSGDYHCIKATRPPKCWFIRLLQLATRCSKARLHTLKGMLNSEFEITRKWQYKKAFSFIRIVKLKVKRLAVALSLEYALNSVSKLRFYITLTKFYAKTQDLNI
jgi:hypothetical protein